MKYSALLPLALGACTLGACATPKLTADTVGTIALPNLAEDQLGERVVRPGQAVLAVPVGYVTAAKLQDDVVVEIIGKGFAFAQEETLPIASLSGPASESLPADALIFCGHPNTELARNLMAASTLGITSLFNQTVGEVRVCFLDEERDDTAEQAVLIGAKSMDNSAPVPVGPFGYEIVALQPMSGESEMRLIYKAKTGLFPGDSVSFDLVVMEQGRQLMFENTRNKVDVGELPAEVSIMGSQFTVTAYDSSTGEITVDVERTFPLAEYGLRTVYSTQRIPIYVPR